MNDLKSSDASIMRLTLNCSFANYFACSRIFYEDFSSLNRSERREHLLIRTDVMWTSKVNNPSIFVTNWFVCNRQNVTLFFIISNQFSDIIILLFLLSKPTINSNVPLLVTIVAYQTLMFWVTRGTFIITSPLNNELSWNYHNETHLSIGCQFYSFWANAPWPHWP